MSLTRKKNELKTWLLFSFVFSFMLCVFAPLDFYFTNSGEYWFSPAQLLAVCGVVFAAVFLLLALLSLLLIKPRFSRKLLAAFFFLFLYLYIQGNVIPRNYGVLNGQSIDWGAYPGYAAAALGTAVLCAAACILVCTRFKKRILKIVRLGSLYMLIILLGTTAVSVVTGAGAVSKKSRQVVTVKDEFVLSGSGDIVVLLLDTFDAGYFNTMLEEDYDGCAALFRNFTYYPDCTGAYPTTKGAVPYILTGVWYENGEPFPDYYEKAMTGNPVNSAFAENGYVMDVYTKSNCLSAVSDRYYSNVVPGEYLLSDPAGFAKAVYKMVAFNYMPHQFKRFFWMDSEAFSEFRETAKTADPAFSTDVIRFAKRLRKNGVSAEAGSPRFKFYHLLGVHSPYTFGEDLTEGGAPYTVYDSVKGNFTVVRRFLKQLKNTGLYDETTVIVMADHGSLNRAQNPLFLIKNAGEKHAFAVSDDRMSWEYLSDIWIGLAGGRQIGHEFFEEKAAENPRRRYLYYHWDDSWKKEYLPAMEEFYCEGDAGNPENLVPSGRTFPAGGAAPAASAQ